MESETLGAALPRIRKDVHLVPACDQLPNQPVQITFRAADRRVALPYDPDLHARNGGPSTCSTFFSTSSTLINSIAPGDFTRVFQLTSPISFPRIVRTASGNRFTTRCCEL